MKTKLSGKTQLWIFGAVGLLFMLLIAVFCNLVLIGSLSSNAKQDRAELDRMYQLQAQNAAQIEYLESDEHKDYVYHVELGLVENGKESYKASEE